MSDVTRILDRIQERVPLDDGPSLVAPEGAPEEDLLALDDALRQLEAEDPVKARLVKLRFFVAGTAMVTWQAVRARAAEQRAEATLRTAIRAVFAVKCDPDRGATGKLVIQSASRTAATATEKPGNNIDAADSPRR